VSSFGGSGFEIDEAGDGLGKSFGLAIRVSCSNDFFSTSLGVFSRILVRMLLPKLAEIWRNDPLEAVSRRFKVFLSRPI
jgi:hypothetical protein